MTEEAEGSPPSPADELGGVFRAAREKAGATPDQVAEALHLDVTAIAAIEEGRFERLPMRPYARGYVRNYARLLGLDADDLVARFEAADVSSPEPSAKVPRHAVARRSEMSLGPIALGYFAIVAVLIAAVGAVLWMAWQVQDWQFPFLSDEPEAPPEAPPAAVAESPVRRPDVSPWPAPTVPEVSFRELGATDDTPETQGGDAEEAAATGEILAPPAVDVLAVGDADPVEPPAPDVDVAPIVAPAPRVEEPINTGEGSPTALTVVFDDDSWVSVDDATGRRLYGDLGRAGRTITVDGQPPLQILIGNAPAVRVEFGGEAVDLEPYTSRENVARLELGG